MKDVDRIAKDVSRAAENVGDELASAVRDLAKEIGRMREPEPRIPAGVVALIALAIVALVVAIVGGAKLSESRAEETQPYA